MGCSYLDVTLHRYINIRDTLVAKAFSIAGIIEPLLTFSLIYELILASSPAFDEILFFFLLVFKVFIILLIHLFNESERY